MDIEQMRITLKQIKGYHFAFKASSNEEYRTTRDNMLKQLKKTVQGKQAVLDFWKVMSK